jgi:tetratricopeptide (TPR) repeat protein
MARASELAAATRADDVAADALRELVWGTTEDGRAAAALAMAPGARAAAARTHDPRREATLAGHLGAAHIAAGDAPAAIAELTRGLRLAEAAFGTRHARVAQMLNRLGNAEESIGHSDAARDYYARALVIIEAAFGADHPSVAVTRANLCYLDSLAGHLEAAAACQVEVIATLEAALGPQHAQVAWARNDAGLIASARGQFEVARAQFEQALAIWRARLGPSHPDVAWPLINLGELALRRGDADTAERQCRAALAILDGANGFDHPDAMGALLCVAAALADHRPREAAPVLDRAARLVRSTDAPEAAATLDATRARVAWGVGQRREAASLARSALAGFEAAGATGDQARKDLEAWMKRRGL